MSSAFAALPHGRVLQYHNVTPAKFFAPYAPSLFRLAAIARDELAGLARASDLALGDSEYNRQELEELGFSNTGVLPIAVNTRPADRRAAAILCSTTFSTTASSIFCSSGGSRRTRRSRTTSGLPSSTSATSTHTIASFSSAATMWCRSTTRRFAPCCRSTRCSRIVSSLPEPVPDAELAAYYRASSVYVSLSEHEGFCVPLVEAMAMDVPGPRV